ncbi:hypothetical protein [Deinococcus sp.]|uniref:hypothetical protein n=1 Tax=Deinococcus sp. TaxID=47478 RepID=UPI003C7B88D5
MTTARTEGTGSGAAVSEAAVSKTTVSEAAVSELAADCGFTFLARFPAVGAVGSDTAAVTTASACTAGRSAALSPFTDVDVFGAVFFPGAGETVLACAATGATPDLVFPPLPFGCSWSTGAAVFALLTLF